MGRACSFRPAAEAASVNHRQKTDMACKRSKGFSRCLDVLANLGTIRHRLDFSSNWKLVNCICGNLVAW